VYRSPNAEPDEIASMLTMLKSISDKQVLVMGDFNYPKINWNTWESDASGEDFLDVILNNFWTQHVSRPTREDNILDLVISSEEGMVENLTVDEHLGNSDHNMVCFQLVCETKITAVDQVRYNYNKGDYNGMHAFLSLVNWNFDELNVDDMWCKFRDTILQMVKQFVPISKQKKSRFPRWMTREALRARNLKHKMWQRYQTSKLYNDKVEYKRVLNKATATFREAKFNFEKKLSAEVKTNPRSFYAYVRSKSKTKDKVGPLKDDLGNVVVDDERACNVLNKYFSSVFTRENKNCTASDFPVLKYLFTGNREDVLHDVDIDEVLVVNKLNQLRGNKAPGVDGIVPMILLKCADVISKPLCKIFNASLNTGIVPSDWRRANVTAIFKKGRRDDPANYRPVSLTCIIGKVMESIIKDRIDNHLTKFNLIGESQHGFTKKKSCLTNLLEFFEFMHEQVDSGQLVDVIYLDFQKAFDKVPHRRLVLKVEAYGIVGNVLRWIDNWLTGREQRVVLNQQCSDWSDVISGVPQGSVLGPLLFVLFINDIDRSVVNRLLKFADDTKLFGCVSTQQQIDVLRADLNTLFKWSEEWQMVFNVEKCKVMHFGKSNVKTVYNMGVGTLSVTDAEKDLGVIVQNDLKVSQQCVKVTKTANQVLGMIKRTFKSRSNCIILRLYKSLVRPHLEYCVQSWRPHLEKDKRKLENVQKRVLNMLNLKSNSYEGKLVEVNMSTLETRRLRGDLIEVFKIFKGFDVVNSHGFFTLSSTSLRGHGFKLYKHRFLTDVGKFSFSNRIVNEWNLLTPELLSCNTVEQFKIRLDLYLRSGRGFI
jgi:hypothetical protein